MRYAAVAGWCEFDGDPNVCRHVSRVNEIVLAPKVE